VSLRCDVLNLHKWSPWQLRTATTKHLVVNVLNQRAPDQDFTTSRPIQVRTCKRCGLTQKRNA